ncbi:MAG: DNA-binding protein [Erysipelotrichaceae bacterium]|nr:DNA-binding protein [Erysipelotrichaceae bacterium]
MIKRIVILMAVLFSCGICTIHAETETVSSNDLIDRAKELDGQTIVYSGEAIGTIMKRDDVTWVNVNDGDNAIGIDMSEEQAQQIQHLGGYGAVGDTIEIVGVFHRACSEHGGDLDIHATSVKVLSAGHQKDMLMDINGMIFAVIIFIGASVFVYFTYRKASMINNAS